MKRRSTQLATMAFAAGLLLVALVPHSLLHRERSAAAGSHGNQHPQHAHLDHTSVEVICLACLFGLRSPAGAIESPAAIDGLAAHTRLVVASVDDGVADLSYRLPLSRAPPLS